MNKRNQFQKLAVLSAFAITGQSAYSVMVITLTPNPTGADITIIGSFNTDGINALDANFATTNNFIIEDNPMILFRSDGSLGLNDGDNQFAWGTLSGDGISGSITAELPYTGDVIAGWGISGNAITFPSDYVSGNEISLSGSYTGAIFESNGGSMVTGQTQRVFFPSGAALIFTTGRPIPEPSSVVLALSGLLLATRRRRKN